MTLLGENIPATKRAWRGLAAWLFPPVVGHGVARCSVIAHRGACLFAPENTVQACRIAIEQGASGVEVDVCVTADNHVVLWHDRDPDDPISVAREEGIGDAAFVPVVPARHSPFRRPVTGLDLATMRRHFGYVEGTGIVSELLASGQQPAVGVDLLEDVARYAAHEPRLETLFIDVKLAPHEIDRVAPLVSELERLQRRYPALAGRHVFVLCSEREIHRELSSRALPGNVRIVPDVELPGAVAVARELGARDISVGITPRRLWSSIRADLVGLGRARRRGQLDSVTVWTVDDRERLEKVVRLGVDHVLTNDIVLARRVVDDIRRRGT